MIRKLPRKGRRRVSNNPSKHDRQLLRDLYYLTETLNRIVGMIFHLAIVGLAFIIVGIGIARAIYLLD